MPGIDRNRAFSTSSGGSTEGAGNRRLSRGNGQASGNLGFYWVFRAFLPELSYILGMSMEEADRPNIRRLSITVNDLPPIKK